jgi:hypothetical protein
MSIRFCGAQIHSGRNVEVISGTTATEQNRAMCFVGTASPKSIVMAITVVRGIFSP